MIAPPAPQPHGATDTVAGNEVSPGAERDRWGGRLAVAHDQLFALFFFVAFIFFLYELYRVFSSFLLPIVWAAILAMLFYPLHEVVLRQLRGRVTLAALLLTTLVAAAIVLPTVSLSTVVTRQSASLYQQLTEYVGSGRLKGTVDRIRDSRLGSFVRRLDRQGWDVDWGQIVQRSADTVSNFVVTQATAVARNVAAFVLDFTIMVFTLFFLFRDGERMYRGLRDLIPMDPEHKDAIFHRLYETLSAVMRGMVVTAVAQGVLTSAGLWALGFSYTAFLGVLAGVFSLIPFAGAAGVWLPCTIYLALTGEIVRAVILLAYGVLVISMVDNVLRPLVIGGRTRLPTLFLFFGILGGVQAYGVLGIFLGPVLLAIVIAFINIYKEQYATPEARPAPAP